MKLDSDRKPQLVSLGSQASGEFEFVAVKTLDDPVLGEIILGVTGEHTLAYCVKVADKNMDVGLVGRLERMSRIKDTALYFPHILAYSMEVGSATTLEFELVALCQLGARVASKRGHQQTAGGGARAYS